MAGAQVWGGAKLGIDDDSANSVHLADIRAVIQRTVTTGKNHIGDTIFLGMGDERCEVNGSGLTAAEATTGTSGLATALTSANSEIWTTDYDDASPEVYLDRLELGRTGAPGFETGAFHAIGFVGISGTGAAETGA